MNLNVLAVLGNRIDEDPKITINDFKEFINRNNILSGFNLTSQLM
jgi:hypothetical protein